MNVKYFRFDFSNNTIVGSKTALKKAGNPASEEYKELMKMREVQPKFKIAVKEIKVNDGKRSYKGLNQKFVEAYISIQVNAEVLNKQYCEAKKLGRFPLVRKWFLSTFEEFDMEKAKEEIARVQLIKIHEAA